MASSRGIIYYNINTKCLVRLMTSIYSLRKVYDGPCTLIHEGKPLPDLVEFCACHRVDITEVPHKGLNALVRKSQLWRDTPYDTSIFLDADTIVLQSPAALFSLAESHGFVVHHYSDWRTDGGMMTKRISAWRAVIGKADVAAALAYGKAINTGVFAFNKQTGAEFLRDWEQVTAQGWESNCTRRLVDEVAAQVILHRHRHAIVGPEYGVSGRFAIGGDPIIIHYHGSKHVHDYPLCDFWKQTYVEMRNEFGDRWPLMTKPNGDKRFARWYAQHDGLTMVTAVNPTYLEKLKANWPKWMKQKKLKRKPWLVFANEFAPNDSRLDFLRKNTRVRIIDWAWPIAGDNVRERMLSAFVFGTAQHVKTAHWMKLDADATPTSPWRWPDYREHVICGHRCGYTVSKGANETGHFLNILDRHKGGVPAFPPDITAKRYAHERLASYCWIERTDFTRDLAKWCGDRLPVPSHDTVACYYAQQVRGYNIGEQLLKVNMRRYFTP